MEHIPVEFDGLEADDELYCSLPDNARILVIGLGGAGSIALPYLAIFLRSLSRPLRLVLIDGDVFEAANVTRMHFTSLGNKAELRAEEVLEILDGSEVSVVAIPEYITEENVSHLIQEGDYVFTFLDNHPSRKVVSDYCELLSDVTLISAGNDGVDPESGERGTYGNAQIAVRQGGVNVTVPVTRFHPEIADPVGEMPGGPNCGQMVISTPQILFANLQSATAALCTFFAYTCGRLSYQEVAFDILEGRMTPQLPLPAGQFAGPAVIA
jgi:hypothetical protein